MMQVVMLSVAIFVSRLRGFLLGFVAALLDQVGLVVACFSSSSGIG